MFYEEYKERLVEQRKRIKTKVSNTIYKSFESGFIKKAIDRAILNLENKTNVFIHNLENELDVSVTNEVRTNTLELTNIVLEVLKEDDRYYGLNFSRKDNDSMITISWQEEPREGKDDDLLDELDDI